MLTQERLRELLSYDPETGIFTWLVRKGRLAAPGTIAGTVHVNRHGYRRIQIKIDGATYRAHRLAWLYCHGAWPAKQVDHVNRDATDNRLSNLREATRSQNQMNRGVSRRSKSGLKGVCARADSKVKPWAAFMGVDGKCVYLGPFRTKDEASAAYMKAAAEHHGEFAVAEARKRGRR